MSFPCVLGMNEVGWQDGVYHNNGMTPKLGGRSVNGSTAANQGFEIVGGKSNGEVASYLFQRQGVATSFSKTVAENEKSNFSGQRWPSMGEGMSDQTNSKDGELEDKFQSLSLNNNEKKPDTPIEEIASTAKKLWDIQDSGEENQGGMTSGIFFGEQWRDTAWGPSVPHMAQSEHAVSQPIMVQRPAKGGNFNTTTESQNVLSPRSADGVGLSMVEYVLASSPGGQELDTQIMKPGFGVKGNGDRKENKGGSPFEEETGEEVKNALQDEQGHESPKPTPKPKGDDDVKGPGTFSRTPGSRQPSPTQQQDATQVNQTGHSPQPVGQGKAKSYKETDHIEDIAPPVALIDPLENVQLEQLPFGAQRESVIGTPTSPSDFVMVSGSSLQSQNAMNSQQSQSVQLSHQQQQLALAIAAQQQQQQQQLGLQSGLQSTNLGHPNPYFITAQPTQDPFGNPSLSAQQVVHPQYAAYSVPPWGMYSAAGASGSGGYLQQQQQQQQQQQAQHAQLLRSNSGGMTGRPVEIIGTPPSHTQQAMAASPGTNYQLIAPPGATPLGLGATAYYDQSGNLVLGNTQNVNNIATAQMAASQMGALRMVSPVVVNAQNAGASSVSAGRMGSASSMSGGSSMGMFGQQTQQQQQQLNNSALGMLGNVVGGSSGVGAVGTIPGGGTRRDSLNAADYGKRPSIAQYYATPGGVNSLASLSISAQPTYNAPQELPTPPLLSQGQSAFGSQSAYGGQSGFTVGSPISNGLSRYMQLAAAPRETKYQGSLGSLTGVPFGTSSLGGSGFRGSRGKESGRSRLLEDFRNNRYPNIQLRDLANHIVEFSQDQHGSRFIQQKLERALPNEKQMVFHEILPAAYNLMTDVFGNYVIQKFFEFGSPEQKHHLANCIRGHVLPLALQMYGCRVIQKALECISADIQNDLVRELDGHVLKCVRDQNGNHVVQKCIECVDPSSLQFIIGAFQAQVYALSTHPYGCRVIQRILEHCMPEQTAPILDELHQHTDRLVQDQYGNYVIQHVLEHGTQEDKSKIVHELRGNILIFSQHKFASNVVEKCVTHASRTERAMLIDEVCSSSDSALYTMMKDQFANYVIQKMIDVAEPPQRKLLMHRIRPHVATLRKYTYGKHILAKLEKYYMTIKPTPDFLPLSNGPLL